MKDIVFLKDVAMFQKEEEFLFFLQIQRLSEKNNVFHTSVQRLSGNNGVSFNVFQEKLWFSQHFVGHCPDSCKNLQPFWFKV